jgi:hypothetical protein
MKKYSLKFWIVFWAIAVLFLAGWFLFWQTKNKGLTSLETAVDLLPFSSENKADYKTLLALTDYFLNTDGQEKTFLILFQNNMEIRPGGGYIGSFGILKIKNGKVTELQTHDLSNFDGRVPDTEKPPYPMEETLGINSWKLRDSNFSPDFAENAKKAEYFYHLGKGEEQFDGVIGITANVLTSFLKATGPIQIEGYPGTYEDENAIIALEYQVEKAFAEQGLGRGERKNIMNDLAKAIIKRVFELNSGQKLELAKISLEDLKKKDIQLYFKDSKLQKEIEDINWGGRVDSGWKKDFLMISDANMGALKSDYYVKRSIDYSVDMSGDVPKATLKITYNHTAKLKDWMAKDYLDYLRVYVPEGSWLENSKNFDGAKFGNELGKKYFGSLIKVPLGQSKTIEIVYSLPKDIKDNYDLKIQKQAGINDVPVKIQANGKSYDFTLNSDVILSEIK